MASFPTAPPAEFIVAVGRNGTTQSHMPALLIFEPSLDTPFELGITQFFLAPQPKCSFTCQLPSQEAYENSQHPWLGRIRICMECGESLCSRDGYSST